MRFELARALLGRPRLLVLDEPLAPLDIAAQQTFLRDLHDLAKNEQNPIPVILSSQHIPEVESIADAILYLDRSGHPRFYGSSDQLADEATCQLLELSGDVSPTAIDILRPLFGVHDAHRWNNYWILRLPLSTPISEFHQAVLTRHPTLNHFRNITRSCTKFFHLE